MYDREVGLIINEITRNFKFHKTYTALKYLIYLCTLSFLVSCFPKEESVNKFSNPEILRIADLQDRRNTDSLLLYLSNDNALYRKEAALAFASVQDTLAANKLGEVLLADIDTVVQSAAAFALGQSACKKSEEVLLAALTSEKSEIVLREVLEALGKTISTENIQSLLTFKTSSLLAEEGKAWGLYRVGLRGLAKAEVSGEIYPLLTSSNSSTRLASANFFARATLQDFPDEKSYLRNAAADTNVFVRIAATQGLRNVKTDSSRIILQQNIKDSDERVRVGALRGLRSFLFADVSATLFDALNDSSLQVRVATAEALNNFATKEVLPKVKEVADAAKNWRVQASLYEVAASLDPQKSTFESIKGRYNASTNSYQKAALLSVLGQSASNYSFIGNELINSSDPVILTSAALSLTACNNASDFSEKEKPTFLKLYQQAIEKADAAVTGIIAQLLGDSSKNYKPLIKDISFLKEAKSKLMLPKDNEAMQPVEAALAYLEGRKAIDVKNDFNHPINWLLVKSIPANQSATIKTTKGNITLNLFVDEAPGSVANFIMLVNQNYFDGRFFHRVVPNFVIQAGCTRGDGWGSEDYSIRSEFIQRKYKEGSVGMASAGKDTEGTQWFITHSPTPHLDGRYTIFAEVGEGMDVVNAMEVGDKILDVVLK